jgi:membrane protease YdiL (CAAX protease family)
LEPARHHTPEAFARFVEQASTGRNSLPRILIGVVLIVVVWFAGTVALLGGGAMATIMGWIPRSLVPATGIGPWEEFLTSRVGLVTMILTLGSIWPGVWLATRLLHKRPLQSLFGGTRRLAGGDFLKAALATLLVAAVISTVTLFTEPRVTRTEMTVAVWALVLVPVALVLLIQTSAEEILFRGYLMQNLAHRFRSPWVWAILPALLFAVAHWSPGAQPWMNAMVIFAIFLFAMAAVLLVKATGNLGAAMGMHFANNVVAFLYVTAAEHGQSVALYVTPGIADPTWTVTDAIVGAAFQAVMTTGILTLLLWRGSPLRLAATARPAAATA